MPLTAAELEALAREESDRCEFKESLADRDRIKRAICAFANDLADQRAPSVIVVGLRKDGGCCGLEITEELLKLAADFRSDGSLLPMPSLAPRRARVRDCDVLVIEIQPTMAPPMRHSGVVWIRSGPTNQKASPEEERRLTERVRWNSLPFDQRPVPGATLDDLDIDLFLRSYLPNAVSSEVLAANERTAEHQLAALRLATPSGQPTYGGILLLAKDVRRWLPGAYIQFVRLDGELLTDPVADRKEIDGTLFDVMRRLDELLELNIRTRIAIVGSTTERREPDYPLEALRQLSRNAVMHRTYEGTNAPTRVYWFVDRVEIHNPGGPFGIVNRQNFGEPGITDYRNPQLAEAMRVLGYVQRFGAGIPIAKREMERNQNPLLEFQVEAAHVAVTLRRRP